MEKKKITARKPSSAEEQERALQLLMQSTPRDTAYTAGDTPSVRDVVKPVAPPKAKKEPKPRKAATPRATLMKIDAPTEVQRITIDLPLDLYDALKSEVESSGTTMKWQIVKLLRDKLKPIS